MASLKMFEVGLLYISHDTPGGGICPEVLKCKSYGVVLLYCTPYGQVKMLFIYRDLLGCD